MANARTHFRCSVVIGILGALVALGHPGGTALGQTPSGGPMFPSVAPSPGLTPESVPAPAAQPEAVPTPSPEGPALLAADEEPVVEVRIKGLDRVSHDKAFKQLHTRQGRPFDRKTLEEDVRRLNKTGLFFNVKTHTARVAGGHLVVFEVVEKPIAAHVWYVCNFIQKKKLEEESQIKAGDAMDLYAIEESRRRIEEYCRTHGYPKAHVSVIEGTHTSDKGVIFLVNEGNRARFGWTDFEGNTIADDARLRTQIKSKPGIAWYLGGDVDFKEIEEDLNRLTAYYRNLGFFSAQVSREWHWSESGKWLMLTFVINEGPRSFVRNVSIVGNTKFTTPDLMQQLDLHRGEYFNQGKRDKDVMAITDVYGAYGFVFAKIEPETVYLEDPGQVDLVYRIKEGDRYRVGMILPQIKGEYPHTRLTTVLNRMSLKPGDIVDTRELRASERRLRASGLFGNDPSRGIEPPKIVFSPPSAQDLEKEENAVARKRPDGLRGQSPDVPESGDRVLNLTIQGYLLNEPAAGESPAVQPQSTVPASTIRGQDAGGTSRRRAPVPAWMQSLWTSPAANQAALAGTEAPDFAWGQPGQGSLSLLARGQYSDGVAMPQFNPNAGRVKPYTAGQASNPWTSAPQTTTTTTTAPASTASGWQPAAGSGTQPSGVTTVQQPVPATPPQYTTTTPTATPTAQAATPAPSVANQFDTGEPAGEPTFIPPGTGDPLRPPPTMDSSGNLLGLAPDAQPLRPLPLFPQLSETETGKLMFSVGVNSDAGLIGSVIVDEQNFDWQRPPRSWEDIRNATAWRGRGQHFRAEAVPGTLSQKYAVSLDEPYFLDTNWSLGLSALYFERNYEDWREERLGGRISLGRQLTPDLTGIVSFRGFNINISDPAVNWNPSLNEALGNNALYGFEGRLIHDTRDSKFMPTEGHILQLAVEQVVGTFKYPRADAEVRQFFMLHERPDGSGRHVLSLGGQVAVTGDDTPIYDRYFVGGFSTIRGFEFRKASPFFGVYEGGDFMALASAEYMFPITASDALRGVVFVDTGVVQPTINDWTQKFRVAPGVGLRITIPAMGPAPIALDLAFPVVKEPTDDTQIFSFFVGFQR